MTDSPHPFDTWTWGGLNARYYSRQEVDGSLEYIFTPGPPVVRAIFSAFLLLSAGVFAWHTFTDRYASIAFNLPILLCVAGAGLALLHIQKRLLLNPLTGQFQVQAALFIFSAEESLSSKELLLRVLPGTIRRNRNAPSETWYFLRLETPSGFHSIYRHRALDRVMEEVIYLLEHCQLNLDMGSVRRDLDPAWLARLESFQGSVLLEDGTSQTGGAVRFYSPTLDAAAFHQNWQNMGRNRLKSVLAADGLTVSLPWLRLQKNAGLLVIPALFLLGLAMMYFEFSSGGRVSGKSTLITIFFSLVTVMVIPHLLVSESLRVRNAQLTYSQKLLGLIPVLNLSLPAGVLQEVNQVADATGGRTFIVCVLANEMRNIQKQHSWMIVWNLLDLKVYPGVITLTIAHGLGGEEQRLLVSLLRGLTRDQKDGYTH